MSCTRLYHGAEVDVSRLVLDNLAPHGRLAQLVEQRTLNPFVIGSIPISPTKLKTAHRNVGRFRFYLSNFIAIQIGVRNEFSPLLSA